MEWLEAHPLPIGDYAESFVDWLTANFTPVFDGLTAFLQAVIDAILFVLTWPHPFVVIAAFCLIAWLARRSIFPVLFTLLGFLLIINLGFWEATTQTLALVIAATVTCMVIGVPLGQFGEVFKAQHGRVFWHKEAYDERERVADRILCVHNSPMISSSERLVFRGGKWGTH